MKEGRVIRGYGHALVQVIILLGEPEITEIKQTCTRIRNVHVLMALAKVKFARLQIDDLPYMYLFMDGSQIHAGSLPWETGSFPRPLRKICNY